MKTGRDHFLIWLVAVIPVLAIACLETPEFVTREIVVVRSANQRFLVDKSSEDEATI